MSPDLDLATTCRKKEKVLNCSVGFWSAGQVVLLARLQQEEWMV